MPIYRAEEVPDLGECTAISRGVPVLPSGMEKEEEGVSIHANPNTHSHTQRAAAFFSQFMAERHYVFFSPKAREL